MANEGSDSTANPKANSKVFSHNVVHGGNVHIGDQIVNEDKPQKERDRGRKQLLASLRFSEMNARRTDISDPHPTTYEWMFQEELHPPWDSFNSWLRSGHGKFYWIHGKPGAGKSTLMNFLSNHPRTLQYLQTWSTPREVMVLDFYFWLSSGGKFQRTFKGLLSTLLYQALLKDRYFIEEMLDKPVERWEISDWREADLENTLIKLVDKSMSSFCIFVDALDEFDSGESFADILQFLVRLRSYRHVKVCISSRNEPRFSKYLSESRQLQLDSLNVVDIRTYIFQTLKELPSNALNQSLDETNTNQIVKLVFDKAEGVFLWVRLALKTVLDSMDQEDGFYIVMDELRRLPPGMESLYSYMWKRHGRDQGLAREQASELFAYTRIAHEQAYKLSLFHLTVAIDDSLRNHFINDPHSVNTKLLLRRCHEICNRLHGRCAGILETAGNRKNLSLTEIEFLFDVYGLRDYYLDRSVSYIHQSARDFLFSTQQGRNIVGTSTISEQQLLENLNAAMKLTWSHLPRK